MKCEIHKYNEECSFCPDCETERLLSQDSRLQKILKENNFKKADYHKKTCGESNQIKGG